MREGGRLFVLRVTQQSAVPHQWHQSWTVYGAERKQQQADCQLWSLLSENGPGHSYHGLHRLPALGLGSRQEEIFGISPKIHLQIDVELHGVACLCLNAYYTGRIWRGFPDQRRLFGLISPLRSTVTYLTGMRRILCLHQRPGYAHPAPCVRNNHRHFRWCWKTTAERRGEERRGEARREEREEGLATRGCHSITSDHCCVSVQGLRPSVDPAFAVIEGESFGETCEAA